VEPSHCTAIIAVVPEAPYPLLHLRRACPLSQQFFFRNRTLLQNAFFNGLLLFIFPGRLSCVCPYFLLQLTHAAARFNSPIERQQFSPLISHHAASVQFLSRVKDSHISLFGVE
jgi:hypothetical protein